MRGYGDSLLGKVLAIQCGGHIGSLEPKSPQQSQCTEGRRGKPRSRLATQDS